MDLSSLEPQIDEAAIRSYCNLVFGYLSGQAVVRLIGETGTPIQQPAQRFSPAELIADLIVRLAPAAAHDQRAVFVLPATLKSGNTARADDVLQTGVILVDLDNGDVEAKKHHLVHHLGTPSMEVASGGMTPDGQRKRHLYWRLSEAAAGPDRDLVARLRGEIAQKVGGDISFANISQPIRVPGTIHGKNGTRNPVEIVAIATAEYHLGEFVDSVRQMPSIYDAETVPGPLTAPGKAGPNARALANRIIRAGGKDEVTRFEAMSRIIGHWLRQVRNGMCTRDEALEAIKDHNAAMIRPPWPEERVEREFGALWNRDVSTNGAIPFSRSIAIGSVAHQ